MGDGLDASWLVDGGAGAGALATVVLAHGAGGHMEHATCTRLARVLNAAGCETVRFDFPYRVRGGGPPDRMPVLREAYASVCDRVVAARAGLPVIAAGHSMGGRVASMLASDGELSASGLLLLGYPLHPAGKPERLRDGHLGSIGCPTLCVNGTRDRLCDRALMEGVLDRGVPAGWRMCWIEGADHSFEVLKRSGISPDEIDDQIAGAVRAWIEAEVIG